MAPHHPPATMGLQLAITSQLGIPSMDITAKAVNRPKRGREKERPDKRTFYLLHTKEIKGCKTASQLPGKQQKSGSRVYITANVIYERLRPYLCHSCLSFVVFQDAKCHVTSVLFQTSMQKNIFSSYQKVWSAFVSLTPYKPWTFVTSCNEIL